MDWQTQIVGMPNLLADYVDDIYCLAERAKLSVLVWCLIAIATNSHKNTAALVYKDFLESCPKLG